MELSKAKQIAEKIVAEMEPNCTKILIAGSIRRDVPRVKDIEIVCIPVWEVVEVPDEGNDMFAFEKTSKDVDVNRLYNWATGANDKGVIKNIQWIKTGTDEIIPWEIKENGKYWRGLYDYGDGKIKVDIFIANRKNWGVIATIRTGWLEFSKALVTVIKRDTKYRVQDGHLIIEETGEIVETPTEESLFETVDLAWVKIPDRNTSIPYDFLKPRI